MISEVRLVDCMEYMRTVPDNWFDLACVDPIYGIKEPAFRRGAKNKATKVGKYKNLSFKQKKTGEEYFTELMRVSKNQVIWGGNYFIDYLYSTRSMIVWDKHTKDTQWADAELAWTSFGNSVKIFDFAWNGMIQGDMKNKEIRIHENQKPVALYSWIYRNYLPNGGKVIDTHLGSGSNRIAADKAGNIDFYSTEIDKDYFEAQEKRWKQYKSQLVMAL